MLNRKKVKETLQFEIRVLECARAGIPFSVKLESFKQEIELTNQEVNMITMLASASIDKLLDAKELRLFELRKKKN